MLKDQAAVSIIFVYLNFFFISHLLLRLIHTNHLDLVNWSQLEINQDLLVLRLFPFSLPFAPHPLWIFCFSPSEYTYLFKHGLSLGRKCGRLYQQGVCRFFFFLSLHSKCVLTQGSFVDILLRFDTVSKVFPKGLKAWVPRGVVFDWCSLSPSMWCVHWCGGDGVRYPCWSWSSEQLARVPHSHSGFAVTFFLLIMTWGGCFGGLALGKW